MKHDTGRGMTLLLVLLRAHISRALLRRLSRRVAGFSYVPGFLVIHVSMHATWMPTMRLLLVLLRAHISRALCVASGPSRYRISYVPGFSVIRVGMHATWMPPGMSPRRIISCLLVPVCDPPSRGVQRCWRRASFGFRGVGGVWVTVSIMYTPNLRL